ncbi:MAG TPA: magnesium transporter MgtE [Patescibacteria group bacterium]|nr:magnesium transporter MgtE [Patescibacteria group bacterium]
MADSKTKNKTGAAKSGEGQQGSPEKTTSRRWLKIVAILFLLMVLVSVGFLAGIFLKVIDMQKIASDYPVVGKFFPKPKMNFEPVDLAPDITPIPPIAPPKSSVEQPAPLPPVQPGMLTKEDIEKQEKIRKQEEAKRIGKLAKLYAEMKPDEAVVILKELDDNTVIQILERLEESQSAKILSLFDPKRAAKISDDILKGNTKPLSL